MTEADLILMSLVIFLPTLFALGLLLFPRGSEEYMRWWALLGTAVTLVVSIWLFIDFQRMVDFYQGKSTSQLSSRAKSIYKNTPSTIPAPAKIWWLGIRGSHASTSITLSAWMASVCR